MSEQTVFPLSRINKSTIITISQLINNWTTFCRIYNVSKPDVAEQTFNLSTDAGYGSISGSRLNISLALGEVSFVVVYWQMTP